MYKVLQVSIDDQGRANQYAYANWDVQGGWNTFTSPVFGEDEVLVGFKCGIKLPDDAVVPDYMADITFDGAILPDATPEEGTVPTEPED